MFNIYAEIANHLRETVPALRTIDADKGQLANPEQAYPMDYPAVLIDLDTVDWAELGKKAQKGGAQIGITVAVLPTGQSSPDSPTLDTFVQEMDVINDVYGALSGFLGLTRKRTFRQKRWDTVQAYTHLFNNTLTDRTAQKTYEKVEVPFEINPATLK
ncbi:hypothetical protein [uncultured Draconibacterium sp.]|uniref:hypothetical protein n=1 Tax=uncultured Draconibacterium sp. TaxID=1573823 RepID=UPI0025FA8168|nr:hypothetical protein [uncultured Draconibacterium sp.]